MRGKSSTAALDTFGQGPLRTACRVPRRQAGEHLEGSAAFVGPVLGGEPYFAPGRLLRAAPLPAGA